MFYPEQLNERTFKIRFSLLWRMRNCLLVRSSKCFCKVATNLCINDVWISAHHVQKEQNKKSNRTSTGVLAYAS